MAYSIRLRRLFSQGANNCATFRFPPLQGKILVVGDGDFSYSVACLRENQSNNGTARITATSLDSKMVAVKKYARARDNIAVLTASTDATVLHSRDVTQTGSLGSKRVWESIVWNFPYPANVTQPLSQQGSTLLAGFFQSARGILKTDGAIYITMRTNRAEKAWGLEGVARTCGFTISKKIPFTASSIDGYEPKRVHCDKKIPNAESCTYVLHTTQTDLEVPVIPSFASDTEHDVCTAQKVCELLASNSNKIRLDQFKSVYQKHFGRPPVLLHSKRLKKSLEKLAFDVKQEGRTSWFLRQDLLKGQIKQKEIHELLASNNNKIRLAQFKSVYQQHFGRPPVLLHSKRLKKSLEKLAFDVKQEGRTSWFLRQDLLEGQIQQKEIHELLASNNNKIRLDQFKSVYQKHFGRPPVLLHSKRLKKSLEKLAFDVKQQGRTSWFFGGPNPTKRNT